MKPSFVQTLNDISGVEIEVYEIRENELVLRFSLEQAAEQHIQAIQNYPTKFNVLGYLFCAANFIKECSIENISQKDATIVVDLTNAVFAKQMKDRNEKGLVDYLKYRVKERVRRFFLLTLPDFQIDYVNSQEISLIIKVKDAKWITALLENNNFSFTENGNKITIQLDQHQPVLKVFQGRFNIPQTMQPGNLQVHKTKIEISIGNRWGRGLEITFAQNDNTALECYNTVLDGLKKKGCTIERS